MTNNSKTKSTYDSTFRKYLEYLEGEKPTKENFNRFMNSLRSCGFTSTSIRLYYYGIKQSLAGYGIDLGLDKPPKIDRNDVKRPYLEDNEVFAMMKAAKSMGGIYVKAVALSTTYGLRRIEISLHQPEDIDKTKKTVLIHTAKGGRPTKHRIPDQIQPFMFLPDKMLSVSATSRIFNQVALNAGLPSKGIGWHSIRRSVVSGLRLKGVSVDDVKSFMRWAEGGMVDIYHFRRPEEDLAIFEKHPFLKWWGEI